MSPYDNLFLSWQAVASLLSYNIRYLILANRVKNIPRQNVVYRLGEIPEVRASCYRCLSSKLSEHACIQPVRALIKREYERASAIAFMTQPKGGSHPGWGALRMLSGFDR